MSRRYQVKKTDNIEKDIVGELRDIPGVKVEVGHDDIFVGYRGKNFWFEIKDPSKVDKSGKPYKRTGKGKETYEKQQEILDHWTGHYSIVTTLDQILYEIGIKSPPYGLKSYEQIT